MAGVLLPSWAIHSVLVPSLGDVQHCAYKSSQKLQLADSALSGLCPEKGSFSSVVPLTIFSNWLWIVNNPVLMIKHFKIRISCRLNPHLMHPGALLQAI